MARVFILDSDKESREQLVERLQEKLDVPDSVERLEAALTGHPWPGSSWEFRTDMSADDLQDFVETWSGPKGFLFDILVIHIEPGNSFATWKHLWKALEKQKQLPPSLGILFWTDCDPNLNAFGRSIRQVQRVFRTDTFANPPFVWVFPSPGMYPPTTWFAHTLRFLWRASQTYPKLMKCEREALVRGPGLIPHAVAVSVDLRAYSNIVSQHLRDYEGDATHQWLRMAVCLTEAHLLDQLHGLPVATADHVTGVAEMNDDSDDARMRGCGRAVKGSLYVSSAMHEHAEMLRQLLTDLALDDEVPANTVQIGIAPGPLFIGPTGIKGDFDYIGEGLEHSRLLCGSDSDYRILAHASCPAAKLKSEYVKILGKECFEKLTGGPSAPYYAVLDPSRQIKI